MATVEQAQAATVEFIFPSSSPEELLTLPVPRLPPASGVSPPLDALVQRLLQKYSIPEDAIIITNEAGEVRQFLLFSCFCSSPNLILRCYPPLLLDSLCSFTIVSYSK